MAVAVATLARFLLVLFALFDFVRVDCDILPLYLVREPSSAPSQPPEPSSLSCEEDLHGVGSLDTVCQLNEDLSVSEDLYIEGKGSLVFFPGVGLRCSQPGCSIVFDLLGELKLGNKSVIEAGRVDVRASNISLAEGSVVNTTALGGEPPSQTSGRPSGIHGDGGGHGGRGASCYRKEGQAPEDSWGGDAYSWSTLMQPDSYGSRGGTTSREKDYGGGGGGCIKFNVTGFVQVDGLLACNGGDGGLKGGGGSGGSVYILALKMNGVGNISASGGSGYGGGGGGRVSLHVYSRHNDPKIFVQGGESLGCEDNNGAAGTFYDAVSRSLIVDNCNSSTQTDTLLLEFPFQPLWTNIIIRNSAKVVVPLLWSRVQVQGQFSLLQSSVLSFGLVRYPYSEFELMAEELLMSDSIIRVNGALRMSVKMLLMWNSKLFINGGGDAIVATSLLEASNLIVLREASVIHSNSFLGIHGQGLLNLSGSGDVIEAQRLVLSLFYSIQLGPGSTLRGPLENATSHELAPKLSCDVEECPTEVLHPPEDCNVNASLAFTLQICRVEDITISGILQGNVIHFHRTRSVVVQPSGVISASGLGCRGGLGKGKVLSNGLGGGGGHGGNGGDGFFNESFVEGGVKYGSAYLPCELGSGSGDETLGSSTAGGGIIVMGSLLYSISSLTVYGSIEADGESLRASFGNRLYGVLEGASGGIGGGSGGTILLFLHTFLLSNSSTISSVGGYGSHAGGGGGGGGRIHFHWSDIATGDEYIPVATVNGAINIRGGLGQGRGFAGEDGTVTGKDCPKGLYGIFCEQCPLGTFKNVTGSDAELCSPCPSYQLPRRAVYINVRGGVADSPCPYKCVSERYHMPHCYTALEELIYTFGGPWLFGLLLCGLLVLLALVLSVARMKFVNTDELPAPPPTLQAAHIDHSFPFLESLNEVLETNRAEESQNHVHRLHFMGPNTFSEPWHLPHSPPKQLSEIVYEDAFNRFVDQVNALAAYQWWEGSIYSILSILAYPLAWSWQQWRRKKKLQQLREFVRSEYDHSCLRSCRSRALYEGLKVAATPDLMLAHVDFFLGGDEKRPDLPPRLQQRFPMCIIFGGDGTYMAPFTLHSDNILTSLMSQAVPPTIWYRLVAGLNAQLRLVRHGLLKFTFLPVISWLQSHANPVLALHGIRVDLAWFQCTPFGYNQFGLLVSASGSGEMLTESDLGSMKISPRPRSFLLPDFCRIRIIMKSPAWFLWRSFI
ncbi:uncharacterized protein LOC144703731 isoform X2 [Wolffia australiana]